MRINVAYAGESPRVIETSGESLLSPSTVASSLEWRGRALHVTVVMLRPRTDLIGQGGQSLVVELCAWSADVSCGCHTNQCHEVCGRIREAKRRA